MNGSFAHAMSSRHTRYLELLESMPIPRGDWRKGEIELVPEPERFVALEERLIRKWVSKGFPECYGHVGVLHEDAWFVFVRDPVLFAPRSGTEPIEGSYIRAIYRGDANGNRSLFGMLRLPDKRFLLNLAYRRPSGQWKLEGSGTITQDKESLEQALHRMVVDEAGSHILDITPIGRMIPERGLVGTTVPIFLIDIAEPSESISDPTVAGHVRLTGEEIDHIFLAGAWEHEGRTYLCDDSFTAYALYQARLRKLI